MPLKPEKSFFFSSVTPLIHDAADTLIGLTSLEFGASVTPLGAYLSLTRRHVVAIS